MKALLFLSLLYSTTLFATAKECEFEYEYVVESKKQTFCVLKDSKFLVDPKCIGEQCGYHKVISASEFSKISLTSDELKQGKNPATVLCQKTGGVLLPAHSEFGHQSFFCRFSDGSVIDTESIYQAYLQKKQK
jgi:putative hemolysin